MNFGDSQTLALNVMNALLGLLVVVPILVVLGSILASLIRHKPIELGHGAH